MYVQKKDARIYKRNQYERNRKNCLILLGGKCVNCGISDFDVLQIDHKIPILKSSKERVPQISLYFKILNGSIDKELLQILCANCHMKKSVSYSKSKRIENELDFNF